MFWVSLFTAALGIIDFLTNIPQINGEVLAGVSGLILTLLRLDTDTALTRTKK
jgi:hypothetical protein